MEKLTLCDGIGCPFRQKCNRHKEYIKRDGRSWFWRTPYNPKTDTCEFFYPTIKEKEDDERRKRAQKSGDLFN
jgi:hypothetical protein